MIIKRSVNGGPIEEIDIETGVLDWDECHVCGRRARYLYVAEDGAHPVCGKHYRFELETDLELWAEGWGTCCEWDEGCGDLVHQFVERHKGLPVLCVKHMAVVMRSNSELEIKIREIFRLENARLAERLLKEVDDGQKAHDSN